MKLRVKRSNLISLAIGALLIALLVMAGCSSRTSVSPQEESSQKEVAALPQPKQEEQKPVTIRLAGAMPASYITSRAMSEVFKPEVEKKSNGLLKVEFYPAGQLFVDKDLNQAVVNGSVEMIYNTFVWWSGQDPASSFVDLPFQFKDASEYVAAMKGKVGAELGNIVNDNGAKFLGWVHVGWIDTLGTRNKPLKKPEDFQGLKMRGWGDIPARTLAALGSSSVAFSSSEVYMALQRGTIDGAGGSVESFVTRKWMEVIKYLIVVPMSMMSMDVAANPKWWNSLTPDQQKIIQEAVNKAEEWTFKEMDAVHDSSINTIKAAGIDVYVVPLEEVRLWREKVGPVYDYYKQAGGDRAARLMEMVKEYTK